MSATIEAISICVTMISATSNTVMAMMMLKSASVPFGGKAKAQHDRQGAIEGQCADDQRASLLADCLAHDRGDEQGEDCRDIRRR